MSTAAVDSDAAQYSASAVDRDIVLCGFVFPCIGLLIGALLKRYMVPLVERRVSLVAQCACRSCRPVVPQSASQKPSSPVWLRLFLLYSSLKLGWRTRHSLMVERRRHLAGRDQVLHQALPRGGAPRDASVLPTHKPGQLRYGISDIET
jgi:hypothetical protein